MNPETTSLWGELPLAAAIRTPISILREQASALTKATNGVLNSSVVTGASSKGKQTLRLQISAPALNNYSYEVLYATHEVFLYPIKILDTAQGLGFECENEQAFLTAIQQVLSSEHTHRVIASLLSQSRDAEDGADDLFT